MGQQCFNSGQICGSPGRFYVHEKVYDEYLEMEYRNNPFLFYYDPDNLLDLVDTLEATIPADNRDTNNLAVANMLTILNSFSCTVIHLAYWIGEFADTSVQFP